MNTKLFTLLSFLFISLNANAQLSAGLVAYWGFNGNVTDSTGNGHSGTPYNITPAMGASGVANTAYYFNGSTSYVQTPYKADLNVSKYSICAIVKPMGYYTGPCQVNAILWRGTQYNPGNYASLFYDGVYDADCSFVDTGHNLFTALAGNADGNALNWSYEPAIVSNNWYTVVSTFDGSKFKIWVNGVLKSTLLVTSGGIGTSTESLRIGVNEPGSGFPYWFKGYMDEVRLYDRVLADSEIIRYTNATLTVAPTFSGQGCIGSTFNVPYITRDTSFFASGSVLSVQLSDASGSFATPTVIGSTTLASPRSTTGTIACFIPGTPVPGAYAIRIVGSTPAYTSESTGITLVTSASSPSLVISALPGTSVAGGTTVTFTAIPSNAVLPAYKWLKNGSVIPGQTSASYTAVTGVDFAEGDTITAMVKSAATCALTDTAYSNNLVMHIYSGVQNINAQGSFSIYPNPNHGNFNITGSTTASAVQLSVTNTIGQLIHTETIVPVKGLINNSLQLNNVRAGIYFIKLHTATQSQTVRITIE